MDGLSGFLADLKSSGRANGNFLGLLNVLIGRRIQKEDAVLVSNGLTWRNVATILKKVRWEKEAVRELGLDPKNLPPRDRERYWYIAISLAHVDSLAANVAGDALAKLIQDTGYLVGPPPRSKEETS